MSSASHSSNATAADAKSPFSPMTRARSQSGCSTVASSSHARFHRTRTNHQIKFRSSSLLIQAAKLINKHRLLPNQTCCYNPNSPPSLSFPQRQATCHQTAATSSAKARLSTLRHQVCSNLGEQLRLPRSRAALRHRLTSSSPSLSASGPSTRSGRAITSTERGPLLRRIQWATR